MNDTPQVIYAGSRQITVTDELNGISFPVLIQYPSSQPPAPTAFGPYTMDVSPDASILPGQFPLVLISHGSGGSNLLYRTISLHLARQGYIVAMPAHYGNNRDNNSLENTTENLINRPRHISLTIDAILTIDELAQHTAINQIAVIGHSMGGYTALALAGGVPYTREGQKIEIAPDPRVRAIVLLAPGTGWFMHSLDQVRIPVLMLSAEHDLITPDWNAQIVREYLPDPLQLSWRVVPNAGHFSFLSPFPDVMKKAGFLPATDPPGFDRIAFHRQLPEEILNFLEEKLKQAIL